MRHALRWSLSSAALLAALVMVGDARAELRSTRGPFYIQGAVPAFNYWGGNRIGCGAFGNCSAWRPDVEFGIHFTGRHDGFVLAFRQAFLLTAPTRDPGGVTVVKLGYDIPIPIKKFELDVGPYGSMGIGYDFGGGGHAGVHAGFIGVDVKFFIVKGFYAFARPMEFGIQCFHDYPGSGCGLAFNMGAGVGYAFPD